MITDNTSLKLEKENLEAEDFLPLLGTDYVEFYVAMPSKQLIIIKQHLAFSLMLMLV
jgi:hypothetical protein